MRCPYSYYPGGSMRKISLLLLMLLTLVVLFGTGVWGQEAAKPAAPAASAAPATPQAAPPVTTTQPAPEATKPPVNEPAKVAPAAPEGAKPEPKGKLAEAIAQTPKGTEKGQINPDAPKGFMGIPGAPSTFWLWYILWGTWVGWIFSSVGAFGGVMAGVGHISVFGLSDYAKGFKQSSPTLNKLLTDSIRTSNQYLVGLSALISSFTYWKMGRLVMPLGLCLAGGGILAGYLVPLLTVGKMDVSTYVGFFGIIVFAVAFVLFYETTEKGQAKRKAAKAAAKAFEDAHIKKSGEASAEHLKGVEVTHWGLNQIKFTFYGGEFSFNPLWPILRRLCHQRHLGPDRGRWRLPVCPLPHLGCRFTHVYRGRHLGPGSVGRYDCQYFQYDGGPQGAG